MRIPLISPVFPLNLNNDVISGKRNLTNDTSLKIQNEQLESKVIEQRDIFKQQQATITQLEREVSTLQDKVIRQPTLFKTNQTNSMQQDI